MLTDKAYAPAGQRTRDTMQLLVAAWPTHCKSLRALPTLSTTLFADDSRASHILSATVDFRWKMGGFDSMSMVNFHLHRDVAGAGRNAPRMGKFVDELVQSIRASGARVLAGDANMALFLLQPMLAARGIGAHLMCNHVELSPVSRLCTDTLESLNESIRYDSCGIWLIGPHGVCKPLSLDARCVLAAMHAFYLLEESSRQRGYAARERGFKASTYLDGPGLVALSPGTTDAVLRIWNAHEVQKLSDKAAVWRFVFERMEAPPPPPRAAPAATAEPSSAPAGSASASTGSASRRAPSAVRPIPAPVSSGRFEPLPAAPDFELSDLTSWGSLSPSRWPA